MIIYIILCISVRNLRWREINSCTFSLPRYCCYCNCTINVNTVSVFTACELYYKCIHTIFTWLNVMAAIDHLCNGH